MDYFWKKKVLLKPTHWHDDTPLPPFFPLQIWSANRFNIILRSSPGQLSVKEPGALIRSRYRLYDKNVWASWPIRQHHRVVLEIRRSRSRELMSAWIHLIVPLWSSPVAQTGSTFINAQKVGTLWTLGVVPSSNAQVIKKEGRQILRYKLNHA